MGDRPKLVFVSHAIGWLSEVWMWRQLTGFQKFLPQVLTWEHINKDAFRLGEMPIKVLDFDVEPENKKDLRKWVHRLKCWPIKNYFGSVGAERKAIETYLKEKNPGVILAQFGFMGLRILPAATKCHIPVVVHIHGLDLSSSLNNRWYKWSLLKNLHKFSAIIVVGSHQKQWMLEQGLPENKIHLIPCGVPADEFVCTNNKPQKDGVRFLTISRLVEKKGLEYSIRAFSRVKEILPEVKLDIVGDGPLEKKLKEQVNSMGLDDAVRFMGNVSSECIREEIAQSDVFLQHSVVASNGDMEGFGVSIAEASASGLPLVCSNATGIIDQVVDGKTGFLVEQKDDKSMAEKMLQLARNPELRKAMGQAGRQRMLECYDTKKQIAKLENVLLSVMR